MEPNFDKLKRMMQGDHHQPLPPELDWSNMKDGILEKMDSIEQAEASPSRNESSKKRIWLFFSLIFALLLTFTIGWFFLFQEETTELNRETVDLAPFPGADAGQSRSDDTGRAAQPHPGWDDEDSTDGAVRIAQQLAPLQDNGQSGPLEGQKKEQSDLGQSTVPLVRRDKVVPNNVSETGQQGSSHTASETVPGVLRPLADAPAATLEIHALHVRESLPDRLYLTELRVTHPSRPDVQEIDSAILPTIQNTRPANQFMLEGGITFWNEGYGNTDPERTQYEAPIPSFQLQGYYMRALKGGYFLMAGLQYQQLDSKLEYSGIIEDYQVTLKDTIVQVQKNMLTGEETITRGDVVQSVRAEHRIRHYNRTQLFKTSLAVGKNWRFKAFQTDVYLGGALNGIVRNQGRMFFEGSVIDYEGASNPLFSNRWTVDGVLGARVHYFPYERIGITTGLQAQRSLTNWSNLADGRMYPLSFGLQVGLSYAW